MFENPTKVGVSQRVVATLVACAVVMASYGVYTTAQAANLTSISDTLSDSDVSVISDHTIAFTIPTGSALVDGDTVTITFPAAFTDVSSVVTGDIAVTVAGGADAHANFAAGATTISFDSVSATAGQEVIVAITGSTIVNPATIGSYEISVNTGTDLGKTRVAIVENVLVTAIVETTFDFTITGLATTTAVNGTSTTGSTSPTSIPFGVLTAGEIKTLAQQLNVTTNAINGFVVTVEQDSDLESATGATIDSFINGSDLAVPAVWSAPAGTIGLTNTYGHWGMTSADADLGTDYTGSKFGAVTVAPKEVFSHTSVSDGTTANIGQTVVGYQIAITPLQEAADDYNTTLTYIATPTF